MELSIVIPVYNEAGNILKVLQEIKKNIKIKYTILIVYDDEKDTTLPVIKNLSPALQKNIKLIKNIYGKGALNAIKTGFKKSEGEYILVTMADLSDDIAKIELMMSKMIKTKAVIACGSRYMKGGKQIGGPFFKGQLSKLAGLSLYYIAGLPVHDATNSFKIYENKFISSQKIESSGGFEIGIELLTKAFMANKKIIEVPCTWNDREAGQSHFKVVEWLPHYIHWWLKAMWFGIKKRASV